MKYLEGKSYDNLCGECQAVVDIVVGMMPELDDRYADDNEGPLMYACDHRMLCGGRYCKENDDW